MRYVVSWIGGVLQEVYRGFLSASSAYDKIDQEGGQVCVDDSCERAFQELKRRLTSAPILIVSEREQRYTVYCDASKDEQGCVLMQSGKVMAYGS